MRHVNSSGSDEYSAQVAWEYEDQKLHECAQEVELGRYTESDKVSGKLDTVLILVIQMGL